MLLADATRWSVCWVKAKNGRPAVVERDFEDDLSGALAFFEKQKTKGKLLVTLRSKNVGWPPPVKYRPHDAWRIVTVEHKGKLVKAKQRIHVTPMQALNEHGITWCPYCMQLRKFRKYSEYEGSAKLVYKCPICGIPHRDHHVRKWNPLWAATPDTVTQRRTRRSNGNRANRRRRRRT